MMKSISTNSQKMAHAAYRAIAEKPVTKEFKSFARGFPTMAHTSGLAQAIAFAQGKGEIHHVRYLEIMAEVLKVVGCGDFQDVKAMGEFVRTAEVGEYMRLSRRAFVAADWIKRYAEALAPEKAVTVGDQK